MGVSWDLETPLEIYLWAAAKTPAYLSLEAQIYTVNLKWGGSIVTM